LTIFLLTILSVLQQHLIAFNSTATAKRIYIYSFKSNKPHEFHKKKNIQNASNSRINRQAGKQAGSQLNAGGEKSKYIKKETVKRKKSIRKKCTT
jgi:hypothetical protein